MTECGSTSCGTVTTPVANHDDVVEFTLLLSGLQASALEEAAFQRGLTAGELVRRVVRDFLATQKAAAHSTPLVFTKHAGVLTNI